MPNTKYQPPKCKDVDGFKGWLILMVCVFFVYLTMGNYNRFGIVKGPIEIVYTIIFTANQHWWLLFTTLVCYLLQIAQTFLLEKCLSMGLISENLGMTLHALGVFFLPTAFTVLARITDANPVVSRIFSTYIIYVMCKVWSYAYVNSTYRKSFRLELITNKNKYDDKNHLLKYPNNITIRNIITYMVFTPPILYQIAYPQRTKPDWRKFWKLCLQLVLVYYVAGLLFFQFLLPEMYLLRSQGYGILNTITVWVRIALPLNLVWLTFGYIHTYRIYLPAYAAVTGFKNESFCKDWWNAEDTNTFWRRWNMPVYHCLKYNVVIPLLQNGYSKTTSNLVAFGVAGIVHEYMNALPFGIYTGRALLFTFTEIPAGYVTEYVARKLGSGFGNIFVWIYLVIVHCMATISYTFVLPHFVTDSILEKQH